jgi:hypothetical protein
VNSGSASFHLRQLAKYGLVEEVVVPGRQKPWRATAQVTVWSDVPTDPEMAAAAQLLSGVVAEHYCQTMRQWLDRRPEEPLEWQQAAWFGDIPVHLTADELTVLGKKIEALAAPYQPRAFDPEQRPAGSRPVTVLHVAVPRDAEPHERADPT